ncbi:hypothetical protein ABIC44_000686 [Sphingomonas sp. 1185]
MTRLPTAGSNSGRQSQSRLELFTCFGEQDVMACQHFDLDDTPAGSSRLQWANLAWMALACILLPMPALADPCTGSLPRPGTRFVGVVRHVIDGDGLCVGPAGRADRWIEVRLADFYAPELREPGGAAARARLASLTKGRSVACIADHRSYDRIVATCSIAGRSIGTRLREEGGGEGGRGFGQRRRARRLARWSPHRRVVLGDLAIPISGDRSGTIPVMYHQRAVVHDVGTAQ